MKAVKQMRTTDENALHELRARCGHSNNLQLCGIALAKLNSAQLHKREDSSLLWRAVYFLLPFCSQEGIFFDPAAVDFVFPRTGPFAVVSAATGGAVELTAAAPCAGASSI